VDQECDPRGSNLDLGTAKLRLTRAGETARVTKPSNTFQVRRGDQLSFHTHKILVQNVEVIALGARRGPSARKPKHSILISTTEDAPQPPRLTRSRASPAKAPLHGTLSSSHRGANTASNVKFMGLRRYVCPRRLTFFMQARIMLVIHPDECIVLRRFAETELPRSAMPIVTPRYTERTIQIDGKWL